MKAARSIIILTVFLMINSYISLSSKEIKTDLNFASLKTNEQAGSKIILRNINNKRPKNEGFEDLNLVGMIRDAYGIPTPIKSETSIAFLFKSLITEALNYSGFEILSGEVDANTPILDVDIDNFIIDGYMIYSLNISIKIKLYSSQENRLLSENALFKNFSKSVFRI